MKNRLLMLSLLVISVFCSCKKDNEPTSPIAKNNTLNVTVENSGTLGSLLERSDLKSITRLIINGNLNDEDIFALKSIPKLTYLDILNTSVKTLPKLSFAESILDSVILPKNLQLIGDEIFFNCQLLESVAISDGVKSINANAFFGCKSLISIKLPDGLNSIGEYAFFGCSALASIELPGELSSIGEYAFGDCASLTSIEFGAGTESIGYGAFVDCSSLTSITVSASNKKFKDIDGVLYTKDGKTIICYPNGRKATSYVIDNAVEIIYDDAFGGCTSLISIKLPAGLNSIGARAFLGCSALASIELPGELAMIGSYAFGSCTSLTSIELGTGTGSIGYGIFNDCSSLTSITVSASNKKFKDIDGVLYTKDGKTIICYPQGRKATSYVIDNTVEFINAYAFFGCTSLTSIKFPDGLNSIEELAFAGCSALASIELPNSLQSINYSAFTECGLTSVLIPEGVISIGYAVFDRCANLKSVVIASTVTEIGVYTFNKCSNLTTVSCLAVTPPIIGDDCFYGINPSCLLKVPAQSVYKYKEDTKWSSVFNVIEPI